MTLPGYTAEVALYRTTLAYRLSVPQEEVRSEYTQRCIQA